MNRKLHRTLGLFVVYFVFILPGVLVHTFQVELQVNRLSNILIYEATRCKLL